VLIDLMQGVVLEGLPGEKLRACTVPYVTISDATSSAVKLYIKSCSIQEIKTKKTGSKASFQSTPVQWNLP
jgi:hypothetical protein